MRLFSRLLSPRFIPSMDFLACDSRRREDHGGGSHAAALRSQLRKAAQDLEIRYLANRDPNLFFALLTDFADADRPETEGDSVLQIHARMASTS